MKNYIIFFIVVISFSSCKTLKEANFGEEYISYYKGNYRVEIPEMYELVNVMVALTDCGQLDSNMINMTTDYYTDVMNYFSDYKKDKQIKRMNSKIKKPLKTFTYINYIFYRMNALGYSIDENDKVHFNNQIPQTCLLFWRDPIKKNKKYINNFIEHSKFREFYSSQRYFYDSLIISYEYFIPIDKMTYWLTRKFPDITYDSYKIIISPLVNGTNYTKRFSSNGLTQIIMSVSPIVINNKYDTAINVMNNSRIVFTEIDHNFVNIVSDSIINKINNSFSNLNYWRKKSDITRLYNSPYLIFNEYMTWALFSLYCIDSYQSKDYDIAINMMEKSMIEGRDFIMFKEFNQELIHIYKENPDISMLELYRRILEWSYSKQESMI